VGGGWVGGGVGGVWGEALAQSGGLVHAWEVSGG